MATHSNPVKKTQAKRWPRTISKELHSQWLKLQRQNDIEELVTITGKSDATIRRALKYGHVNQQAITDAVNAFFKARLETEIDTAAELEALNQELQNPSPKKAPRANGTKKG